MQRGVTAAGLAGIGCGMDAPRSPSAGPTRRTLIAVGLAGLGARVAQAGQDLSFAGLYGPVTADGIQLTPAAQALVGRPVTLQGFMAPPLKAEASFFVLTRYAMSSCPFCSNAADWPVDIVFVRLGRAAEALVASYAIAVTGILEAGIKVDPDTGFVSLVRVVDATWRQV